jgi:hypothetical protein
MIVGHQISSLPINTIWKAGDDKLEEEEMVLSSLTPLPVWEDKANLKVEDRIGGLYL